MRQHRIQAAALKGRVGFNTPYFVYGFVIIFKTKGQIETGVPVGISAKSRRAILKHTVPPLVEISQKPALQTRFPPPPSSFF